MQRYQHFFAYIVSNNLINRNNRFTFYDFIELPRLKFYRNGYITEFFENLHYSELLATTRANNAK